MSTLTKEKLESNKSSQNNPSVLYKFTQTYHVANIEESNDYNYLYLTVRQFQFEEIATQLEEQANKIGSQKPIIPSTVNKADSSSPSAQLRELANQIKQAGSTISDSVDKISNEIGSVTNSEIVNQIKTFLGAVKADYLPKVNEITAEVTPEKFGEYYGFVATVMVAVSGSILGLGLLSGILTYAFYKNVDGKLIRKSSQKSELTNHVKYILKKYPEIKEKIADEF